MINKMMLFIHTRVIFLRAMFYAMFKDEKWLTHRLAGLELRRDQDRKTITRRVVYYAALSIKSVLSHNEDAYKKYIDRIKAITRELDSAKKGTQHNV